MDWDAYKEGRQASVDHDSDTTKVDNPYPRGSKSWESWNRGWNTHYEERWNSDV